MAKSVLLGVNKFTSKAGKDFEVMFLASELKAAAVEKGCFGKNIEQVFVPDDMRGRLTPADIGKEVVLDYEVSNGRAYLIGFEVKK